MEKICAEMNIIQELKENSQRAFGCLFDEWYSDLCSFANNLIDNQQEAEDLVSRSFDIIWNKRTRFSSKEEIKAYLYIIVRNACRKFLKRRKYRIIDIDSVNKHPNQPLQSDIEHQIINAEIIALIMQKADELPPICKMILMDLFKGLSTQEIAEKNNITPSTVRTQKARAINFLKTKFSGNNFLLAILFLLLEIYEN